MTSPEEYYSLYQLLVEMWEFPHEKARFGFSDITLHAGSIQVVIWKRYRTYEDAEDNYPPIYTVRIPFKEYNYDPSRYSKEMNTHIQSILLDLVKKRVMWKQRYDGMQKYLVNDTEMLEMYEREWWDCENDKLMLEKMYVEFCRLLRFNALCVR